MPKGLKNWSYKDVVDFLKYHGFSFFDDRGGSHEAWISEDGESVVEINKTKSSYPVRTLETMIRQSNVSEDIWREWARAGGKKQFKKTQKKKDN